LSNKVSAALDSLARPKDPDMLKAKQLEVNAERKNRIEDRYVALLTNPNCPAVLQDQISEYFQQQLGSLSKFDGI